MPIVWMTARTPHTLDELSAADQAQLKTISLLYYGEERPLASLIPPPGDPTDDGEALYDLSVVALMEDGVHAYDAWSYQADSGTFFRAGTTEVVGEIIQCGFEPHLESEAGERFAAVYREHFSSDEDA